MQNEKSAADSSATHATTPLDPYITTPHAGLANTADLGEGTVDHAPRFTGRYLITADLGAGGFGTVYKAFDPELKRDVAIKVPHAHRLATASDQDAYLAEAQSLARLDHPGIVPVYDVGRLAEGCYIVSKFVPGGSLSQRMRTGMLSTRESVDLVARVAEALHHAHQRGIVHRDIKPGNILMDADGKPLVADFGLALKDEDFGKGDGFSGTPNYMSPEQARGEGHLVDARSDIYSLGVVLYVLLAGQLPYRNRQGRELLHEITSLEVRPVRQLNDEVPDALDRIVLKALAKRPADRYTTALDMARELREVVAPRRFSKLAAPLAAAVALLLFVGWLIAGGQNDSKELNPAADTGATAVATAKPGVTTLDDPGSAKPTDVRLELHFQRAREQGVFHVLKADDVPLRDGDKLQIHVALPKPGYIYLYWYDPNGETKRLWPKSLSTPPQVESVSVPEDEDKWFKVGGERGNEMVIVAVTDKPLSVREAEELEHRAAFSEQAAKLDMLVPLPAKSTERGLTDVVASSKRPLRNDFEDLLRTQFQSYKGLIIPHQ